MVTSSVFFIADSISTTRHVTSTGSIRSFLLGVDGFNTTVIQTNAFCRHAIIGGLCITRYDDFFQRDLKVLLLLASSAMQLQYNFLEVVPRTTGLDELTAGFVQIFGEREVTNGRAPDEAPPAELAVAEAL